MSKRSIADWLSDIVSWGERLERHIAGVAQEDILEDPKTQDAASKCAEAIGMAAYELNKSAPSLEREFPDLQLALAYKSRNRLSHGYLRRGPKHPLEYRVRVDTKNGCSRKIGEA